MGLFQVDFYSKSLAGSTNFNVIIPNDVPQEMLGDNEYYKRNMKTLFLLHGYSGASKDWLLGSPVQELAIKYNIAIIMPSGGNSFYLDGKGTGKAYGHYVGQDLVEYVRKTFHLSDHKDDTFIGGYSMGGFGAIHTGLAYPNTFGKIMALSSALIVHNIANIEEDFKDAIADYYYYTSVFGDLRKLESSDNNPEILIQKMKAEKQTIPAIYIACGTEDFLLKENRAFHKFLQNENVPVQYVEGPGAHDWDFWNRYLEASIQWMLED